MIHWVCLMDDDAILTARCDRPVTHGPISVRLDLAHYRMWPWGDRFSGPRHSRCTVVTGVSRCSARWPRPRHALWLTRRRRPLFWKLPWWMKRALLSKPIELANADFLHHQSWWSWMTLSGVISLILRYEGRVGGHWIPLLCWPITSQWLKTDL